MRTKHFFTFGSEHTLPNGLSANGRFITVTAPIAADHRAIFMGWLGSNAFSTEYSEEEWKEREMERYYPAGALAGSIQVREADH